MPPFASQHVPAGVGREEVRRGSTPANRMRPDVVYRQGATSDKPTGTSCDSCSALAIAVLLLGISVSARQIRQKTSGNWCRLS